MYCVLKDISMIMCYVYRCISIIMSVVRTIDIKSLQNRLLKFCYVPATSASLPRLLFLLQPLTALMKQARQVVCAVKQTILLRCLWSELMFCVYAEFVIRQTRTL
jgi:hypothetical protein